MKALRCDVVRRRLDAFHDCELPAEDRVAMTAHLHACEPCADEASALARLGDRLREAAARRAADLPNLDTLRDAVISRLQAERAVSLTARLARSFEDMHLVWAGLSATGATLACGALLFAMWFFSPPERADSLAGMLSALASPGSDRNPVMLDPRMSVPRVNDGVVPAMLANAATEEDLVFALAAVVTQEGRIARSEVLVSNQSDRDALLLMNAIREARFQPASLRGTPVAVNLVWLLTHTTVRAKIHS
jgi:anti-sigma factor RsiW